MDVKTDVEVFDIKIMNSTAHSSDQSSITMLTSTHSMKHSRPHLDFPAGDGDHGHDTDDTTTITSRHATTCVACTGETCTAAQCLRRCRRLIHIHGVLAHVPNSRYIAGARHRRGIRIGNLTRQKDQKGIHSCTCSTVPLCSGEGSAHSLYNIYVLHVSSQG